MQVLLLSVDAFDFVLSILIVRSQIRVVANTDIKLQYGMRLIAHSQIQVVAIIQTIAKRFLYLIVHSQIREIEIKLRICGTMSSLYSTLKSGKLKSYAAKNAVLLPILIESARQYNGNALTKAANRSYYVRILAEQTRRNHSLVCLSATAPIKPFLSICLFLFYFL